MKVELNHTIVYSKNAKKSAEFVAEILGLAPPKQYYRFHVVNTTNGVGLDFFEADGPVESQHYAFIVGEKEFDEIFGRVKAKNLTYWANPDQTGENIVNTYNGGRGFYFTDLSGHSLEVITTPYVNE